MVIRMVKKKKKYSAKTKGRMLIIFLFFIVIIFTLSYTLVVNMFDIKDLNFEMVTLDKEHSLLLEEEERIEADIKRLKDPEYVARYVREKYLYSRDGELILRFED